jgi:glycosyltransferase involved in cell wall biosynthesis
VIVSILTPTIPERERMLEECKLSVAAQTLPGEDFEHLILTDSEYRGCSWAMNQLAARADGDWLLPLADDDLLLPGCLRSLLERAPGGDVIYSPPLVSMNGETHFYGAPPAIPSCALIWRDLWFELGGYDESARREEDRKLWTKAMERGATFVRVDTPQWVYRFSRLPDGTPRNKSYNGGRAS